MGADDAHGYPILHTTAVRTWHRAAMVVTVVRQTDQIQMSAQHTTAQIEGKRDVGLDTR